MSITDASKAGFTEEEIQVNAAHLKVSTTQAYIKEHVTPKSVFKMTMPNRVKS
jgi:hypothetical protein